MGAGDRFRDAVREAVDGRPVASVATGAGLPRDAIRNVLEGHDPSLSRAAQIAEILDMVFCIGRANPIPSPTEMERELRGVIDDLEAAVSRARRITK